VTTDEASTPEEAREIFYRKRSEFLREWILRIKREMEKGDEE